MLLWQFTLKLFVLTLTRRVNDRMGAVLTNNAKDSQNVGGKYHQHVDEGEENESNGSVAQPVERLGGEQHLLDGSTYLWRNTEGRSDKKIIPHYHIH